MKVKSWISYDEADRSQLSVGGMGGFFQKGMRWKDYLQEFGTSLHPYMEAIRSDVIKKKIRFTGAGHQDDSQGVPQFEDDTVGMFSHRAWGDLMAAIWSTEEDKDYWYMDFYV